MHMHPPPLTANRWEAEIKLGFTRAGTGTVLSERRHRGPLRVQKALYPEGEAVCQTILLHPPSGIAGGDQLHIAANVGAQAHAQITTPGAGKWYRSSGPEALQSIDFTVGCGATLEWLPQETIVFDGARSRMETRVRLAADSRYIGWEILCLGRRAAGERFTQGSIGLHTRIERAPEGSALGVRSAASTPGVRSAASTPGGAQRSKYPWGAPRRKYPLGYAPKEVPLGYAPQEAPSGHSGQPLWLERGRIAGNDPLLHSLTGWAGATVCGTVLATLLPDDEVPALLAACRARKPADAADYGITVLPGLLVARYLGHNSEAARLWFIELWRLLRPALLGRAAVPPRIWTT